MSEKIGKNIYGTSNSVPVLAPVSAADLQVMELPPLVWVVDNILPVGVCVLAAKPKRGKSYFALDLCLSVCNGYDFLGYKTHPGACLYFDLESSKRRPKERIEQMTGGKPAPANLYVITRDELTSSAKDAGRDALLIGSGFDEALSGFLSEHMEIKLVVIDILAKVRQGKTNKTDDYERDYTDFDPLIQIANKYSVCIMCIMHNTKTEHTDPFDDIQGSAGVMGSLDTAMVIQKRSMDGNDSALYIRGRDIEEQKLVLSYDRGKWTRQGTAAEVERQQLKLDYSRSNVIKTVFALLANKNEWTGSATELKHASIFNGTPIGMDPRLIGNDFNKYEQLLNADGITVIKDKKNNQRFYRLIKE